MRPSIWTLDCLRHNPILSDPIRDNRVSAYAIRNVHTAVAAWTRMLRVYLSAWPGLCVSVVDRLRIDLLGDNDGSGTDTGASGGSRLPGASSITIDLSVNRAFMWFVKKSVYPVCMRRKPRLDMVS